LITQWTNSALISESTVPIRLDTIQYNNTLLSRKENSFAALIKNE